MYKQRIGDSNWKSLKYILNINYLSYQALGRHLVCVKGSSITGTVFLSLQQEKCWFLQTFKSTRDYHCKIFGIWWAKVESSLDLHFWIAREAKHCCIIFTAYLHVFCELPILYCTIFNWDACLFNNCLIRAF